jgi:DNA polymerase-4
MDTILSESVGFNKRSPFVMLLDINSCFATIEQQANPLLRGKPVVVGTYTTDGGCVLAASREGKRMGMKTGMSVGETKQIYKDVVVIAPDSNKYRFVNKKLVTILNRYTDPIEVKSIDEMSFSFEHSYELVRRMKTGLSDKEAMFTLAVDIKKSIYEEIGDWITVSIGIAPNRYLAKTGAGYKKPDGLVLIDHTNITTILGSMRLEDLCGIKSGNATRLRAFGIMNPLQIYTASIAHLKTAFHSILGYHWWLRLHGWEADDREYKRKSIGHSYALRKPLSPHDEALKHILYQLIVKMGRRVRTDHFIAYGLHVSCVFRNGTTWRLSKTYRLPLYTDTDFYRVANELLKEAPDYLVRILAVSCFHLEERLYIQETLFEQEGKERQLTQAMDKIAERWGEWIVVPGRLLSVDQKIHDRIAFGSHHSIAFSLRNIHIDDGL